MTLKFKIRTTKKTKDGDYVPVYLRLLDGAAFDQTSKTRILVQPSFWDARAQGVRLRSLCPEAERRQITDELLKMRTFITNAYLDRKAANEEATSEWLEKAINKYYKQKDSAQKTAAPKKLTFDNYYDEFLEERNLGEGRKRHYEVLRRMIHRYESYIKHSRGRVHYNFDITKVDKAMLDDLYDYIENEFEFVERYPEILEDNPEAREIKPRGENYMSGIFKELRAFFNWAYKVKYIQAFPFTGFSMPSERYGSPIYLSLDDVQKIYSAEIPNEALAQQRDVFVFQCNIGCRVGDLLRLKKCDVINGAIEYIPTKTIKENTRTVVVPLNKVASEIVERYADLPGEQLLPFISSTNYNDNIKEILELSGVTYLVTELDTVTRQEKKVPINEIASSHMARRTFIGNIYKLVKDPNLVSALTGHVEGSRAFTRYRTIDIDIKKDLVKILEGK